MFSDDFREVLAERLQAIREGGLYKSERVIRGQQGGRVDVGRAQPVLNLCANNYLGLANHPRIVEAAERAVRDWGYGMASVRFICGTQSIHQELEARLSDFLGTDDTILYSSCFDANGGLFETILDAEDAVISDQLNHASIIDGIRLCKAQRHRYASGDMAELERALVLTKDARHRLIATDGVFSMDGTIAKLDEICDLAERYKALVMVDDSHAVGFLGAGGRGSHEFRDVMGRVDIITGTLGKALGGASGGYTSGRGPIVELLRQRSRPYLFSNAVAPAVVGASLAALDMVTESSELRDRLFANTRFFRAGLESLGYTVTPGEHPIIPIMLGDASLATGLADQLLERGVYVIGFSFPVVPKGQARIRTQMSAAHSRADLEFALEQFAAVKPE